MKGWLYRTLLGPMSLLRPCFSNFRRSTRGPAVFSCVMHSKMSTSNFEYGHIEDVERLEDYRSGGYHPIQIDDCLHKRYRIVHKLGHGTFSTAWLALDEQSSKYVAIKVGTADADKREVDVLTQLSKGIAACGLYADKPPLIPSVIDRFHLEGPNGTHPCYVTEPARCSLMDAKEASGTRLLQLDVARSLAAQLVFAVCLVHSQGYTHGDLHLGNLLLKLPSSLDNLSVEQLYAKFGAPEPEPVIRRDGMPISSGVPSHAVPPAWLSTASNKITIEEAMILLSDFGVAFRPSDHSRFESYTPLVIRPPEALFEPTRPLSFQSDTWSLGCTIFELFAHRSLIDGILAPQDEITAQQVHLQGPLPPEWWSKWEMRPKWFDEVGNPLSDECDVWSWERRFEQWIQEPRKWYGMDTMSVEEKAVLLELLQWMLSWKPSKRPNADEVLETAWIKRWALPAYEKSRKASCWV